MDKKHIITIIVIALVFGGAGFFGGMKYGQAKASQANAARAQQFANGGGRRNGGQGGAGFINGQIISKDDKSITVKLTAGGSKLVFYSDATSVGKTATGTPQDLAVGQQVIANGSANADGSITAQNIQIRPAGMPLQNRGN